MTFARRLFAAALAAVFATTAAAADVEQPARTFAVTGAVAQPTTWTTETLEALPQREVVVPTPDGRQRHYRGVLLRDLLKAARPIEAGRFDLRQSVAVAHASDGYLAVFGWIELVGTATGDGVVVAWWRDGAPLADDEGPFALVSARDTNVGPRHVRWLRSVDLRRVAP